MKEVFSSKGNDENTEQEESMTFDSASQALKEAEELARAEKSGNLVTDEQVAKFESKKAEYDAMRERIRSRASSIGVEKSVTTAEAIKRANVRALSGASSESPELDLSAFGGMPKSPFKTDDEEDEEDLPEEEKRQIDPVGSKNLLQQAREELSNVKWPSLGSTLRLTGIMLLIFIITAAYILALDNVLRTAFTEWGLIPKPDQVFDFTDLDLPDKFTEFMTDEDITSMQNLKP